MQAWVNLTCPYCGHKQQAIVDMADFRPYTRPEAVVCDSEEGGCDKWFVFEARATFTVTTGTIGGDLQPEQPDWSQVSWESAPERAHYHAFDDSGVGHWFEDEPVMDIEIWDGIGCMIWDSGIWANTAKCDWRTTLTKRPQEAR
jgi:hypothetical protein